MHEFLVNFTGFAGIGLLTIGFFRLILGAVSKRPLAAFGSSGVLLGLGLLFLAASLLLANFGGGLLAAIMIALGILLVIGGYAVYREERHWDALK